MPSDSRPTRAGRPRLVPHTESELTPREQILDAAAALFVENGFTATSTRQIAERVGIRQASLYYHFAGKDDMLIELLTTSVRPSLEVIRGIEDLVPEAVSAAGALYALVLVDVETLVRTPHNIGTLYLLPEVQGEQFDSFRAERRELQQTYGRLGSAAATAEVLAASEQLPLGPVLMQLAELVIQLRREGGAAGVPAPGTPIARTSPSGIPARTAPLISAHAIAQACLRSCGLTAPAIEAARRESALLLTTLPTA